MDTKIIFGQTDYRKLKSDLYQILVFTGLYKSILLWFQQLIIERTSQCH